MKIVCCVVRKEELSHSTNSIQNGSKSRRIEDFEKTIENGLVKSAFS